MARTPKINHQELLLLGQTNPVEAKKTWDGMTRGQRRTLIQHAKVDEYKSFIEAINSKTMAKGGITATLHNSKIWEVYNGNTNKVVRDGLTRAQADKLANELIESDTDPNASYGFQQMKGHDVWRPNYIQSLADGGKVAATKTVQIDDSTFYATRIDITHLYLSNNKDFKGTPYHVAEFRGRPFYNELRDWLKETEPRMAAGGKIDTSGMSVREFLKAINHAALPEKAAMYFESQILSDPDMDLLTTSDEEVQDLRELLESEFPGALGGETPAEPAVEEPAGELTLKDYQESLEGATVLLEFEAEGSAAYNDLQAYIDGLKAMIDVLS